MKVYRMRIWKQRKEQGPLSRCGPALFTVHIFSPTDGRIRRACPKLGEVTEGLLFRDVQIQRLPSSSLASDWPVVLDSAFDNETIIDCSEDARVGCQGERRATIVLAGARVSGCATAYALSAETTLVINGRLKAAYIALYSFGFCGFLSY
jgi:hypothetical protein